MPPIDRSLRLLDGQWIRESIPKSLIVCHHTVSGSAKGVIRYWSTGDPRRIGTAYIVARDGTIHETFPPDQWCWHLGLKDSGIERRSIGIEIASEGALSFRAGKLFSFPWLSPSKQPEIGVAEELLESGKVVRLSNSWRGYQWFDSYEQQQIKSVVDLIFWLCDRFNIPKTLAEGFASGRADLNEYFQYNGIIHHAMLRRDKTDLHPIGADQIRAAFRSRESNKELE